MADGRENLKPWQPGQSGNPSGKPKDWVSRHLRARCEAEGQELANVLWAAAVAGDVKAAIVILERTEGKLVQPTHESGSLEILVTRADRQR